MATRRLMRICNKLVHWRRYFNGLADVGSVGGRVVVLVVGHGIIGIS